MEEHTCVPTCLQNIKYLKTAQNLSRIEAVNSKLPPSPCISSQWTSSYAGTLRGCHVTRCSHELICFYVDHTNAMTSGDSMGNHLKSDLHKIKWNYCGKVIRYGWVSKLKQHLAYVDLDVINCRACLIQVSNIIRENLQVKWQVVSLSGSNSMPTSMKLSFLSVGR